jgi:5-methylcytosine-specific restriction endonuclease McrA
LITVKSVPPPPPKWDGWLQMSPKCKCGSKADIKGVSAKGKNYYRSNCLRCRKTAQKAKKGYCEKCLTVPLDKKLLDVDHIDADTSNNHINNLQTLCKPCHSVKTRENWEYKNHEKMRKL